MLKSIFIEEVDVKSEFDNYSDYLNFHKVLSENELIFN